MNRNPAPAIALRALALVLLVLAAWIPATVAQDTGTPAASGEELSTVDLVNEVEQAVVTVINQQTVTSPFGGERTAPVGVGTGFIIDEEGHIVTNWHVVAGGTDFLVILADGTEIEAELIGEDPRDDLAVVQIDGGDVPDTVPLADSNQVQVGETVVAIGSPLGAFQNSVTQGIVGGLDRDQLSQGGICFAYSDLIQHDAAINPGNSGGPLFNLQGEVIGVNTITAASAEGVAAQGLGFAVPSNTVSAVVDQLINEGTIPAPYLGVTQISLTPELSAANDIPVDYGVYIDGVEGNGPAEEAGLEPGDIIIEFGGTAIDAENSLSTILLGYQPGDTVDVTVLRGEDEETLSLTLGEVPDDVYESCIQEIQG